MAVGHSALPTKAVQVEDQEKNSGRAIWILSKWDMCEALSTFLYLGQWSSLTLANLGPTVI